MSTFVIGDIHGSYKALRECMKKGSFKKDKDRLICLGDVCDRGGQVRECIDELLSIKDLIYILGNHDEWALEWATKGKTPKIWLEQGGKETMASYKDTGMPKEHIQLLAQAPLWFIDKDRLYLHAGFDPDEKLENTKKEILLWDRELLYEAILLDKYNPELRFGGYKEIFIGHTPTITFEKDTPQKFCNIWAMDTGAGWHGKLTLMNVGTKEYWRSDAK